jgi:hypothetical protein
VEDMAEVVGDMEGRSPGSVKTLRLCFLQ